MNQAQAMQVLQQGHNVLLSGAAGSGKTYLLNQFVQWAREQQKNIAVTASTGLAATHLNGTTIHNWSGIGVANAYDPNFVANRVQHMWTRYRQAIQTADILVIDEISMLHDFQLRLADEIIRGVRQNPTPFGGLQVVLSGDFFQLPPFTQGGNGVGRFVTESESFRNGNFCVCYLEENHRQDPNDPLVGILNAIRAGAINAANEAKYLDPLRGRIGINCPPDWAVTALCTTNNQADQININALNELLGEPTEYHWEAQGATPRDLNELIGILRHKVDPNLRLKTDAVVMFTKNVPRRGFFNGTLGKVTGLDNQGWPNVRLNNGQEIRSIQPEEWYLEDGKGDRLATISQVPLKLAWAITVHKSQGMTLDAAYIYLRHCFEDGQGYVALSRVRNLADLSLPEFNHRLELYRRLRAFCVCPEATHIEEWLLREDRITQRQITIDLEIAQTHLLQLN